MEIVREEGMEVMGGGEVESYGLEARQRRNLRCENGGGVEDHEEAPEEKKKEEVELGEEGGRSVYFDQHQGLNSSDQNVAKNSEFLDQKSLQNEETEFEANEFNGLADFSIKNQSQTSMKMSLDNGSNSYVFSETETTTVKAEIEEVVKAAHKSKFQVPEFDVERVLEEQETHDLFCPYCKSCITKRVILRKRKRTVQESKYDVKHKKDHDTNTDLDVTPILPENIDDDKVFRCSECFRYFTIKDGGFKLSPIPRRKRRGRQITSEDRERPDGGFKLSPIPRMKIHGRQITSEDLERSVVHSGACQQCLTFRAAIKRKESSGRDYLTSDADHIATTNDRPECS